MRNPVFLGCRSLLTLLVVGAEASAQPLPESFDLGSAGRMTSARSQPFNNCWAYGAYGSFESSLLTRGIVVDPASPEADLSEYHLTWFASIADPPFFFENGGTAADAAAYLSRGQGPVLEQACPTSGLPAPFLPTPYLLRAAYSFSAGPGEDVSEYHGRIKRSLIDFGALDAGVSWKPAAYDVATNTYYDDGSQSSVGGHALTVAGWDDTKDVRGTAQRGAWLVKNSWGSGWGENGFFWLSYVNAEDLVRAPKALIADSMSGFSKLYQHQLGYPGWIIAFAPAQETHGCARFVPIANGILKAIGFWTNSRSAAATIRVYGSWDDGLARPEPSSKLVETGVVLAEAGYHLVNLDNLVALESGQQFVVSVSMAAGAGGLRAELVPGAAAGKTFKSATEEGSWQDLAPAGYLAIKAWTGPPGPVFELTAIAGPNGSVSPTGGTYAEGSVVSLTAESDSGFRVGSWSGADDDSSKGNTNTVTMSFDRTVRVDFEALPALDGGDETFDGFDGRPDEGTDGDSADPDGGTPVVDEGSSASDRSAPDGSHAGIDGAGCGCRATGSGDGATWVSLMLLLGGLWRVVGCRRHHPRMHQGQTRDVGH